MSIQRPSAYYRYSTTDTRKTAQSDKITRINDLLDGIIGEQVNGNEFNKLTYLSDIKRIIADALMEKGQTVEPSDAFMEYASKIAALGNNDNNIKIDRFVGICFNDKFIKKITLTEVTE